MAIWKHIWLYIESRIYLARIRTDLKIAKCLHEINEVPENCWAKANPAKPFWQRSFK